MGSTLKVAGTLAVVPVLVSLVGLAVLGTSPRWRRGVPQPVVDGPRPVPPAPAGPLSGVVVYVSAGHGWLLHRRNHDGDPIAWGRQRDRRFGMVEDDWTADFVAFDLAPALEAAGATVIALRERDRNPEERLVDDHGENFHAFAPGPRVVDDAAVGGSALRLRPGGAATWTTTAPADGHWYAYARWSPDEALDPLAIYTVRLGDTVREVVVDQRDHGHHWWPLGDACLPAGAPIEVTLTGSGGSPLSADAIRLGGGTFRIELPWSGEIREHPFWEVSMAHQLDRLGGPHLAEYESCGNVVSDMRLRPHWATWASPPGEDAVYLSIHTNAAPWGRADGLTVFYGVDRNPPAAAEARSVALAEALERAVHATVSAGDPGYRTRGVEPGDYSEVSPVHNRLPSALLELGFHTDRQDAARLQTQAFKDAAAAGIVEGLVAWHDAGPWPEPPPPPPRPE